MSKPILVIRFPHDISESRKLRLTEDVRGIIKQLEDDYHVIALMENNIDSVKFECYNSPHTEMDFKELKEKLMKSIKM